MGKFTHFIPGKKWVKSGDGGRILQIKTPGVKTGVFFAVVAEVHGNRN